MEMSLAQKAISLAINGEWNEATKVNLEILSLAPLDIDSLNRLAKAYAEVGKITEAKKIAQKVLKIDPNNPIALRCFDKWSSIKDGNVHTKNFASAESFLEEPGKTKIATLVKLGDSKVVASIDSGDTVKLVPHPHSVAVVTLDNKCIGRLPEDLAARLNKLIKSGNKFEVLVKSANTKEVTILIRSDVFSFPSEKIDYVSFTPPELVHRDVPIMSDVEEEIPEEIG